MDLGAGIGLRPADGLLDLLEGFHGSNVLRLAVPLVLFSAVLVAAGGPGALRLSDETLRSVTVTLWLLLINGVLAGYLVIQVDLTGPLYELPGLSRWSMEFWPSLPWPITVAALVLLFDLADYWTHRLMHSSILWGVHAVHHSEQRMTWLTSSRVHLFEPTIVKLGYVALLGWTGVPVWALLMANTVAYLHNRYLHCDVGWNHGPLATVIASPNWHRWHHSVEPTAYNKNYANIFSFLDVIFGTYYNPGRCGTEVGLREIPRPGVTNQLLLPLTHLLKQAGNMLNRHRSALDAPQDRASERTDNHGQTATIKPPVHRGIAGK